MLHHYALGRRVSASLYLESKSVRQDWGAVWALGLASNCPHLSLYHACNDAEECFS
jgi:hypothetical protein